MDSYDVSSSSKACDRDDKREDLGPFISRNSFPCRRNFGWGVVLLRFEASFSVWLIKRFL